MQSLQFEKYVTIGFPVPRWKFPKETMTRDAEAMLPTWMGLLGATSLVSELCNTLAMAKCLEVKEEIPQH